MVEHLISVWRTQGNGLHPGATLSFPNKQDQAKDTTDFDLVTWLAIKKS